jgi:hypothetical protein
LKRAVADWYDTAVRTLTNKALTSPIITNGVLDIHSKKIVDVVGGPTVSNWVVLAASDAGAAVKVGAGSTANPNVDVDVVSRGTGHVLANGVRVATVTGVEVLTHKDLTDASNTFPTSLVTTTGAQNLTNKTLTNPTITGSTLVSGSKSGVATALTLWTGTKAQYDAITTKNPNTIYAVTA